MKTKNYLKELAQFLFTCFILLLSAALIVLLIEAPGVDPPDTESSELRVDPIYGQTLNGYSPQRVFIYEEGDDIRPNLIEVYYFPNIKMHLGEEGHYEYYRTLGKDRVD